MPLKIFQKIFMAFLDTGKEPNVYIICWKTTNLYVKSQQVKGNDVLPMPKQKRATNYVVSYRVYNYKVEG